MKSTSMVVITPILYNVGTNTRKIRGPYILTMEFAGQQGAGTHALVSQHAVFCQ